jgi:hypothetical protein
LVNPNKYKNVYKIKGVANFVIKCVFYLVVLAG